MASASNPNFYIVPSAITITPNSYNNDPQFCIIATAIGAKIRLINIWGEKTLDNQTVEIGYAASLQYKEWSIQGGQYALRQNCYQKDCHVYIRVPKADANTADFFFTDKSLDILGQYTTPVSDASPSADTPVSDASASASSASTLSQVSTLHYFIPLCTLTYNSTTNTRSVSNLDTGNCGTAKGDNEKSSGDWNKVFKWHSADYYLEMLNPFGNIKFQNADGILTNITNIMLSTYAWAQSIINDSTLATTAWIRKYFLSKAADDSTPYTLTAGKLKSTSTVEAQHATVTPAIVHPQASLSTESNSVPTTDSYPSTRIPNNLVFGHEDQLDDHSPSTKGCKIYWTGTGWRIDTDYLYVSKKMYAKEVEVQKVTHIGGEQLLTAASCIADHVIPLRILQQSRVMAYKVYFRAEDSDGRKVTNDWAVGDQAYCQTFNINEGITQDFSNKYYWRLVTAKGQAYLDADFNEVSDPEDGELFNYIILSNQEGLFDSNSTMAIEPNTDHNDPPEVGDHIIQFGYQAQYSEDPTDTETTKKRCGATLLSGAGIYARALIMWELISSFTIPSPKVFLSPDRVDLKVNSLSIVVGEGDDKHEENIQDYLIGSLDGRIIINGDDANPPTTNATFIASLLSAVFGDTTHTISDLVGAVYITTQKMFYLLTYDSSTDTYTWLDDTDGTLRALYDNYGTIRTDVDNILDDNVVTVDEKISLVKDLKIITDTKTSIIDDDESSYGSILVAAASDDRYEVDEEYTSVVDNLFDAIEEVTNAFDTANTYLQFLTKSNTWSSSITLPASVSEASASDDFTASFTRSQLNNAIANFYKAQLQCQIAFQNFNIKYISQSSIAQAKADVETTVKNYVQSEISQLTGTALTNTINDQIKWYYANGTLDAEGNKLKTIIEALDDKIDVNIQSIQNNYVTTNGLTATIQGLFVGNNVIIFDTETNKYTVNTSGLVTKNEFASLFVQQIGENGLAKQATLTAYIAQTDQSLLNLSNSFSDASSSISSLSTNLDTLSQAQSSLSAELGKIKSGETVVYASADHIYLNAAKSLTLGNYWQLDSSGTLKGTNLDITGTIHANAGEFGGYIKTNFVPISTSVATKNGDQWLITNYLNLIVHSKDDSPTIVLPTDANYIGSHVVLYENDSRNTNDDEVVTIITDDSSNIINTGTEINIDLIQFYAGFIDLIGVEASNGKTSWMIYNSDTKYQLYGIKGLSGGVASKVCKVISVDDARIYIGNGFINIKNNDGASIVASRTSASLKMGGTTLLVEDGSIRVIDNNPNTLATNTTTLYSRS